MNEDAITALVLLAAVQCAAVVSPGPAFVVITRLAVTSGRSAATWGAASIGIGSVCWAAVSLWSVGWVSTYSTEAYTLLRICGATYLAYLAFKLWHGSSSTSKFPAQTASIAGANRSGFLQALGIQLANPKAILFFSSVFASFIPAKASVNMLTGALLLVFFSEFFWFAGVARFFAADRLRQKFLDYGQVFDRLAALLLAGLSFEILWLLFV